MKDDYNTQTLMHRIAARLTTLAMTGVCFPCTFLSRIAATASAAPYDTGSRTPRNDGHLVTIRHCEEGKARRGNPGQKGAGKSKKAFSLIELLISLIVISLITTAFASILSTKLQHREIAVVKGAIGTDCTKKFNEKCMMCTDSECVLCINSFSCPVGQFLDAAANCSCKNCLEKFPNCARCTNNYCEDCKIGYKLDSSGACREVICETGQYKTGSECKPCQSPCVTCSNLNECKSCVQGYHLEGNKCEQDKKLPSELNCSKINAVFIPKLYNGIGGKDLCVSKQNAGDPLGPILTNAVSLRPASDTRDCQSQRCCYTGGTVEYQFSTPNNFDYNVAKRTLCNSNAANVICQNYVFNVGGKEIKGWRLPTYNELVGWHANLETISRDAGPKGLQLCDRGGGARAGGHCEYGSSTPHTMHGSTEAYVLFGDNSYMYLWNGQRSVVAGGQYRTYFSGSVRCVIEEF